MAKLSELSDAQRHSIAKQHLSGSMLIDMVGFAGLDHAQLRKLFQQTKMKSILGEEQTYLDSQTVKLRNRLSYGLEDSIDRMKARGNGTDGPQLAFAADKFLIESVLPKQERHVVEQRQTVSFDAQVAIQFADAVNTAKTIAAKLTGDSTVQLAEYTLTGLEGVDIVEPDTVTTCQAAFHDSGNGSAPNTKVTLPPSVEPSDDDSA